LSFPNIDPDWRVHRNRPWSATKMLLHLLAIAAVNYLTFPGHRKWIWLSVVAYYWFFYARMIRFALWTSDTLKVIQQASAGCPMTRLKRLADPARWPEFVVLVPAFGAGRCIQTVAAILAEQDYPTDRWMAIFVSDESESTTLMDSAAKAAADIQAAIRKKTALKSVPIADAALLLYLADDQRESAVAYLNLFGLRRRQLARAWADLLTLLVARGVSPGLEVPEDAQRLLSELMEQNAKSNATTVANISSMMGIKQLSGSLAAWAHVWAAVKTPRDLPDTLRIALRETGNQTPDRALRARLLSDEYLSRIAAAFIRENPSTSDAINATLARLNMPNLVHFQRPEGKRNKASALNFALGQAMRQGWLGDNTHIMVLDSDSFLPGRALALSALEIVRDPEPNVIRQLLPVTTTNFNGRNWFVRTIIAADSLAAPGRWAGSVRTQVRSDLQAGSGVVIPASFLAYLTREYGEAWNTDIICEDARMIISQYAILDGGTKRTKMVPAYVLEGAPEQERVWPTYVAFWRQRVRWALGGMDEIACLLRVPMRRILIGSCDFLPMPPRPWMAVTAEIRKLHLLLAWSKEHLCWSGIALAPILWLAAEVACGAPPWPARFAGYLCLLLVPGVLLEGLFQRQIAPLIPGGVSRGQLIQLFFALILVSVPFILPVVFAQLVCVVGLRNWLAKWNPATPKPGSQLAMGEKNKSDQTLLVTASEKES
jgi:cellulose synthase/poly-beta-1,6-N-acetylglucosamine synthase-like glycosyltransferase